MLLLLLLLWFYTYFSTWSYYYTTKQGFGYFFFSWLLRPQICPSKLLQHLFLLLLFVHFFATCCLFVISSKNRNMIIINMIRGKIVLFDFLGELTKLHVCTYNLSKWKIPVWGSKHVFSMFFPFTCWRQY